MADDLRKDIGMRIRLVRDQQHLTQEQLAERLESSPKHMGEVERGVASFSLRKLIDVSEVLDCSLDYLVKGSSPGADAVLLLPGSILRLLSSDDENRKNILLEYLRLFSRISRLYEEGNA